MTVLEALKLGPASASVIAAAIGRNIVDTYQLLVSAEARGEVRVIVDASGNKQRAAWEAMQ